MFLPSTTTIVLKEHENEIMLVDVFLLFILNMIV